MVQNAEIQIAPETLELFVGEQKKKAKADNFLQIYRFKKAPSLIAALADKIPGITLENDKLSVDFAQISDPELLSMVSNSAEDDYVMDLHDLQVDFVKKSNSKTSKIEFERWLCKRDLYYLGKYVLGYSKAVFHLHKFMCDTMENLPDGYRGLREFPRDSFKSTFMTISFIVQQLLNNPNIRILLKSNTVNNAASKLKEARNHFEKNDSLRRLFPEHCPVKRADQGNNTYWKSPANTAVQNEGSFNAAGVGSSSTSQHYDMIIGDDFWDEDSVASQETMTKCNNDLNGIEYLLGSPEEGKIIFIGTRFAHDDPTKGLLDNIRYRCVIVSGITRHGRSLFPEAMSVEHLYSQYHSHRYNFSCQIMLNPSSEDSSFSSDWFKYLSYSEVKKQEREGKIKTSVVILTDAAGQDKTSSDPVAILAVVKDSLKRKTVVEYVRKKLNPLDFLIAVSKMYDKYNADYAVRQNALIETVLEPFIDARNKDRKEQGMDKVRWEKISLGKQSKMARMSGLQPYFQRGEMYFDPAMENLKELQDEILSFPFNMSNDDGMDALSEITDELVSRCPRFAEAPPPPVESLPTRESVIANELNHRRLRCAEAFKAAREDNHKKGRPGACVA